MDGERFDTLVQRLSRPRDRRSALGVLAGMGLGGFLAFSPPVLAKKKRNKCKGNTRKCGKRCIPKSECCGGCANGLTCCDGACVDLSTSRANCGVCGNACVSGPCVGGFCRCGLGVTCPEDCGCGLRIEGDLVCTGSPTAVTCDSSSDCPPLSACQQTGGGPICMTPCLN